MALIKSPDGGFYVDEEQFEVDYENNSIIIKGGGSSSETVEQHNANPNAHSAIQLDCGDLSN